MGVKISNRDYMWSYAGVILSLLSNLIMTPFVIYFLDTDSFGLWSVFQSLAAITTLFDFGFSTTFARNINYCWNGASELVKNGVVYSETQEPNFYLMKKTMNACRIIFLILSSLAFILLSTVGSFYISHISFGISGYAPLAAWMLYSIAIFLNLYFGYYGSFLRGVGAITDVNKATVFSRIVQILLTVILLALGFGIIGTSIAYLAYGTLYRQSAKKRFFDFNGIGAGLKKIAINIPKSELCEIFFVVWHNAWREGLVSVSNYLANQACTIIVSLNMSLAQTGAYSLAVQIGTAVSQVSAAMYTANQPVLQSAYISKDWYRIQRTMSLIVVSYCTLNFIGLICAVIIGLPLLRIIKPETVVGAGVMIGIGFYQFVLKFRNCYTSYFSCTNRVPYVRSFVISAFACIVLALISMGCLQWGIWGLIAAQLISQCMFNAWYWARTAHKEMKLSARDTVRYGHEEIKKILKSIYLGGRKHE